MSRALGYVGDGERDRVMLPALVTGAIGERTVAWFSAWHDIQLQGDFGKKPRRGYGNKLKFAIRKARRDAVDLVAVVDEDGQPDRLEALRAARDEASGVAVAVGQAAPHGEAWLLDDLVALRQILGLKPDARRPDRRRAKEQFDALANASEWSFLEAIQKVAAAVDPERCRHAKETGFEAFVDEVKCRLP